MTIQAAGILFQTKDGRILLLRRAGDDHREQWCTPGGVIEANETPEQAARREVTEETGYPYDGPLMEWTRRVKDGVDFITYLAQIDDRFPVTLNSEHDKFIWVQRDTALELLHLHPGVVVTLLRFDMTELDIAKAMRAGELTSPQRYGNVLLVALRITGTGASYRTAIDEFVWRDASLWTTPEAVQRCNGLPVILEHPESEIENKDGKKVKIFPLLTTEEFRERIVGTIFLPYVDEALNELWGIAKIFDGGVALLIEKKQVSTSPGVGFSPQDEGNKYRMEDGKKLLVEGKPTFIDHVAIVPMGVWDRGVAPMGVDSITAQADSSADDKLTTALAIMRDAEISALCCRLQ